MMKYIIKRLRRVMTDTSLPAVKLPKIMGRAFTGALRLKEQLSGCTDFPMKLLFRIATIRYSFTPRYNELGRTPTEALAR